MMKHRTVSFHEIEIRHYNLTLGRHLIDSDYGPALTMDWSFSQSQSISVEDYERKRECSHLLLTPTSGDKKRGYFSSSCRRLSLEKRMSRLVDDFGFDKSTLEKVIQKGVRNNTKRKSRTRLLNPKVCPDPNSLLYSQLVKRPVSFHRGLSEYLKNFTAATAG